MSIVDTYVPEVAPQRIARVQDVYRVEPLKALRALGRLLKDKEDTAQVFEIMRALSGRSVPNGYARLLATPTGGSIAFRHQELAEILSDQEYLSRLPEGSVGRAYLHFTTSENISAQGLIEESRKGVEDEALDSEHPHAWYGRRLRDIHDIWHVLTGYGRDALGETCVVSFSYAQTKSTGFALIGAAGALKLRRELGGRHPFVGAAWQAYRNGAKAAWLPGEDYVRLLGENLEAARARLNIAQPTLYQSIAAEFRNGNGEMMAAA